MSDTQHPPDRTELLLAAVLQAAAQPLFALGPAGEVTLWGAAAARAFGWTAEEVVGRPPPMLAPGLGPALAELRGRAARAGRPVMGEARWRCRDGAPVALRLTLAPAGAAGEVVVAATELAEAGAARVAVDRYGALAEHGGEIVLFARPGDGRILEANAAAAAAYGRGRDELARLSLADLDPAAEALLQLGPGEGAARDLRYETAHRRADGGTFPAEVRAAAAEVAGQPALLVIVRDISASRQAGAERDLLRAALSAAVNAVVITDTRGNVQGANAGFTTLTGYEVAEVLGRKTSFLRSGRHDDAFYQGLWDTVLAGRSWQGELVNRRKDGALYVEEMTITPVFVQGQLAHFVAIKQEVTARVERAREREAMLTIAEAMRQARTRADLLPILLEQTCVLLQAEVAALAIGDPATGDSVFELGLGAWEELGRLRLPPGAGVTGRVIATGELYHSDDLGRDPALARPDLMHGARAAVCAPLRSEGAVIGALWAGRQAPMGPAERRLAAAIADLAANAIRRSTLSEQTERQLRRLIGLRTIDHAITNSFDMRLSLSVVLDQTVQQLGVDAAAVLTLSPHSLTLEHAASRGFRTNAILGTRVRLGEGLPGQAALERKTLVAPAVADPESGFVRRGLIAAERFASYIAVPLVARGHVRGVLEVFHRAALPGDAEWLDYLEALAGQAAIAVDNAELFQHMQRANTEMALAYDTTLEGWSRALELRDKETEGHSQRVTELTVRLARAMGLGDDEIVHIRRGALLHDIGKVGIPDAILLKPGPLTPQEREVVKLHPTYAYELLRPIAYLRPALAIPHCHHERWDGTGYPRGLRGEEIPLAARIFAVVDVYDAVTSDRPYQAAWPVERALAMIREESGRHFDPRVVAAFMRVVAGGEPG